MRQSKEELRAELKSLQERQQSIDEILAAVAEADLSEEIMERLRSRESIASISGWVQESRTSRRSTLPSFDELEQSGQRRSSEHNINETLTRTALSGDAFGALPQFSGLDNVLWPLGAPKTPSPMGTWTSVSADTNLVHHLLGLYFCWEYPIFASLSKEAFMGDFHHGNHQFCSSILVNALLALGCCWSARSMIRAYMNESASPGDLFFDEAKRQLDLETNHRSLTTVQALGIMSMREISCGRDLEGRYYSEQSIRLAIEMGLHREYIRDGASLPLQTVKSVAFWGAFTLDRSVPSPRKNLVDVAKAGGKRALVGYRLAAAVL